MENKDITAENSFKKISVTEQVRQLEERAEKAEQEISQLRGTLVVNFCDYPDRPKDRPHIIWSSIDEFNKETLLAATMKAFEYLRKLKS